MKDVLLLFFITSCYSLLLAEQKLLTLKLKNNSLVDIVQLEQADMKAFACCKEVWMKAFYDFYTQFTPEQLYLEDNTDALMHIMKLAFEHEENDFLLMKESLLVVAVKDVQHNKIIAFASYDFAKKQESNVVYIRQLVIDALYRNNGLGRSLIFDVIKLVIHNQRALVTVCTRNINQPAVSFYHKLGFQDTSIQEIYPEWPEKVWRGFKLILN